MYEFANPDPQQSSPSSLQLDPSVSTLSLPFKTDDYFDNLTPWHADLHDNALSPLGQRMQNDWMWQNGHTVSSGFDALRAQEDAAKPATLPSDQYNQLATTLNDTAGEQPAYPKYTPPTLNPAQAALIGLGAALDPRHAAADVAGGLEGVTNYANQGYQREQQAYAAQQQAHQEAVRNLLSQLQMQSGRDEASARLDADQAMHRSSLQQQSALDQARLNETAREHDQQLAQDRANLEEQSKEHLLSQYHSAPGLAEMQWLGKQLGYDPASVQADFSDKQAANRFAASHQWSSMLSRFENARHEVAPEMLDSLNQQRAQIAQMFHIDPSDLREPMTPQARQVARDRQIQSTWDQQFALDTNTFGAGYVKAGQAFAKTQADREKQLDRLDGQIEQARERALMAHQSGDLDAERSEIESFNQATRSYNRLAHDYNAALDQRVGDPKNPKGGLIGEIASQGVLAKTLTGDELARANAKMQGLQQEREFLQSKHADSNRPLILEAAAGTERALRPLQNRPQGTIPPFAPQISGSLQPVLPQVSFNLQDMPKDVQSDPHALNLVDQARKAVQAARLRGRDNYQEISAALRAQLYQIAAKHGYITHPG